MDNLDNMLGQKNYDVRISRDARFMDQKCTPDVVCIIADCILNLRGEGDNSEFTVQDIWDSQYFISNVKAIFNKPSASNPTTKSEYDKFIQQPLRLLAYAGVLTIEKRGIRNYYTVAEPEILEYISLRERNAYIFLYRYFTKVLSDSGLLRHFERFKDKYEGGKLSQADFVALQEIFIRFIRGYTPIRGTTEIKRIFPKLMNVYSCANNLPGSLSGRLSKHQYYYTDLMYNRNNWRDLNKDKTISRQEADRVEDQITISGTDYSNYLIQKVMNVVRKLHRDSEVKDQFGNGEATQVHHIFPRRNYHQLAHYMENLIKLTATQHYTKAHPSNKTDTINADYQLICLLSKCDTIEASLKKYSERYYRKESLIHCINTGLGVKLDYGLNFLNIKRELAKIYNSK